LGVLRTAYCIAKVHAIQSGHIGSEATKQAEEVGPVHPLMHSYDLLAEIRALRSQLPFTVEFFWVEGRQQEWNGKEDYFGHLNDLCDNLAKAYLNQTFDSPSMEEIRVNYTPRGLATRASGLANSTTHLAQKCLFPTGRMGATIRCPLPVGFKSTGTSLARPFDSGHEGSNNGSQNAWPGFRLRAG
jgi:hypothetical protein